MQKYKFESKDHLADNPYFEEEFSFLDFGRGILGPHHFLFKGNRYKILIDVWETG